MRVTRYIGGSVRLKYNQYYIIVLTSIDSQQNNFFLVCEKALSAVKTLSLLQFLSFFFSALELVGPNYRSFVTVLTCLFYTCGLMLLSVITYFVRDWVQLCLITSTPFTVYFLYCFVLPESPRWLLAKGRLEEALTILENLARVNKKEFPPSFKQKLKQRMMMHRTVSEEKRLKEGPGLSALFKTPNMRLKTCLITLNWFASEMVYVGLSYYGPSLGSNQYLSFLLSSAVEIPSYLVCWMVMDTWGRRWPLAMSMISSGILCAITVLLPEGKLTGSYIEFPQRWRYCLI